MARNYLDFPLSIQRSDRLRSLNQREAFWMYKLWATKYPALNKDLDDIIASSKANKGYKKEFKLMFDAAIYSPCGVEGALSSVQVLKTCPIGRVSLVEFSTHP